MGFLSDFGLDDLLKDLKDVGEELGSLRDEVIETVKEAGVEAVDLAKATEKTVKDSAGEVTRVISDFKRPNNIK